MIFSEKFTSEYRIPVLTLENQWGEYELLIPSLHLWLQVFATVGITGLASLLMWAITYYTIIPLRSSGDKQKIFSGYLIGFGIAIPFLAYTPIALLEYYDVQNLFVRFAATVIFPVCSFFRVSEAMFGYNPKEISGKFSEYVIYNAIVLPIEYEKIEKDDADKQKMRRPVKASFKDTFSKLIFFLLYMIITGLHLSFFEPSNFQPFSMEINANKDGVKMPNFFDYKLILNNLVSALLFQFVLTAVSSCLAFLGQSLFRYKTPNVMENPVFTSTSIAEFWGERWNLLIHENLKRGVFKPLYRATSSKFLAVIGTFLVSGLFHEFVLYVIMLHPNQKTKAMFGGNIAFMLWNAGTLCMEFLLLQSPSFCKIRKKIPTPLLTLGVLMSAMPIAHWFIHPYTDCLLFQHAKLAFPIIRAKTMT